MDIKLYEIYHAPELKKVGVTCRGLETRLKEQSLSLTPGRLLHSTIDLREASDLEDSFRKQFGYKKDSLQTYFEKMTKNMVTIGTGVDYSVGLNKGIKDRKQLADYLANIGAIKMESATQTYEFNTQEDMAKLVLAAKESQYPTGDFYWQDTDLKLIGGKVTAEENAGVNEDKPVTTVKGSTIDIKTTDDIVLRVFEKMDKRSLEGQRTYGGTMMQEIEGEEKDFMRFINDVQEELMDALLYIESAKECINRKLNA